MDQERRTVVITGASSGIGRACALRLDRMGWTVFAGVRKERDGRALRDEASERLVPVTIDVTDEAALSAAAQRVATAVEERGLDGLVNNAGIAVPGAIEVLPLDALRRQLEINVIGQIAATQAFLPLLRKGRGRIVNMSSIAGKVSSSLFGAYSASKHAMEALSDTLRIELHPWGIQVAIVEPGKIATPIWEKGETSGQEIWDGLPQAAHDLYAPLVEARKRRAERRRRTSLGIPPEKVAIAVAHALTARRPKIRYVVGKDARIAFALAQLLPTRVLDRILIRKAGVDDK
jgi:NAD(P)-dependent dehydrogenase (short-subunit alcohol dehydrogenase family)